VTHELPPSINQRMKKLLGQKTAGQNNMEHTKKYQPLPSGAGRIACSCGWESPAVDDNFAFTLGRKQKTVDQYFCEHLASLPKVETAMIDPAPERAVAAAQHAPARKPKSK
jgi:hypothetical protein